MANPTFGGAFNNWASKVPDLEASLIHRSGVTKADLKRLVSRIHAGSVKQSDFLKVMDVSHPFRLVTASNRIELQEDEPYDYRAT
jgi:hypothetical protein